MSTSQPAQRRGKNKASTAAEFKKSKNDSLVELPSGNRVKMRRPGMLQFLESGLLPDPLAQLIRKQISDRSGKVTDAELMKSLVAGKDFELIKEMMRATDRVVAFCVYEPQIVWHEREVPGHESAGVVAYEDIPDEERDPEIVYTDEMEMDDKMFIFQRAVGGSTDLSRFRSATSAIVGDLSAG